jgi:hypothetical protein
MSQGPVDFSIRAKSGLNTSQWSNRFVTKCPEDPTPAFKAPVAKFGKGELFVLDVPHDKNVILRMRKVNTNKSKEVKLQGRFTKD